MTGYFIAGFIGGLAIAVIMAAGLVHRLRTESNIGKKTIDRLERYNTMLQHKLQLTDRQLKEVSEESSVFTNF